MSHSNSMANTRDEAMTPLLYCIFRVQQRLQGELLPSWVGLVRTSGTMLEYNCTCNEQRC